MTGSATMAPILLMALGAAAGGVLRFALGTWFGRARATLVANSLACGALGFVLARMGPDAAPSDAALALGIGFCGALSTWSTLALLSLDARGQAEPTLSRQTATVVARHVACGTAAWVVGVGLAGL